MHEKSMRTLEFDKIVRQLAGLSFSDAGRWRCGQLKPVPDLAAVAERQQETADAEAVVAARGLPPMYGLHDIRSAVRRSLTGAVLSARSLLSVASFLRAVSRLRAFLPETADQSRRGAAAFSAAGTQPEQDGITNRLYTRIEGLIEIDDLERAISRAILSEEEISDQASRRLAGIREQIRTTQSGIRRQLESMLQQHARALQEQLITMRSNRYVLPVKASHRGEIPGIVHDASSTGQTVFIEPAAVVEANNRIRELEIAEQAEIERVLAELSGFVAGQKDALFADYDQMGWIDFMLAKARLARQMKAVMPELNDRGSIQLYGARHPLIDSKAVVPIDLYIGQTFRTLVITGPNTGGKTVSLKTCGLLTLMAMAGLHIPAEPGSSVSVFRNVMADIGDEQSIEQSLSTFSAHMKNMVSITSAAGPGMLVLADELGSGTDPSEGAALAMAILDYLRAREVTTIATTHYRELKAYALEQPMVENACCEFNTDTLEPTYRLLIGVPGVSNAFVISKKLGLNKNIIQAARAGISESSLHFENLIRQVEQDRSAAAELRRNLTAEQHKLKEWARQLDRRAEQVRQAELAAVRDAREQSRRMLQKQIEAVDSLMQSLRSQAASESLMRDAEALRHTLKRELNETETAIGTETLRRDGSVVPADQIIPGETYYCVTLKANGRVEQGPDSRRRYLFKAGALSMWVAAADLAPASESVPPAEVGKRYSLPQQAIGRPQHRPPKTQTFTPEVNLLGQTASEALVSLDRFIDEAVLAGARSVRIVHGKGSGVLRSAVTQELNRDRRISSFRLGQFGEGDSGVTIAELK